MEIKVTGSEKQIAWATDIINKMIHGMEWAAENAPANLKDEIDKAVESVLTAKSYKVIDAFKDCKIYDDAKDMAREFIQHYASWQKVSVDYDKF